jgi:hypothetical protein
MNIGDEVYEHEVILRKVYLVYDKWVGNDSVFPLRNIWSPEDHDQVQRQTSTATNSFQSISTERRSSRASRP